MMLITLGEETLSQRLQEEEDDDDNMIGDLVILSLYGEEEQDHDDDNRRGDVFIEIGRRRR